MNAIHSEYRRSEASCTAGGLVIYRCPFEWLAAGRAAQPPSQPATHAICLHRFLFALSSPPPLCRDIDSPSARLGVVAFDPLWAKNEARRFRPPARESLRFIHLIDAQQIISNKPLKPTPKRYITTLFD